MRVIKNRIEAVGIELEGGWNVAPDLEIIRDGSVAIPKPQPPKKPSVDPYGNVTADAAVKYDKAVKAWKASIANYVGEIPSPPMPVADVDAFIRKYYPPFVNDTCGLHVHMSFKHRLNYQRLLTPDYTPMMIKGLLAWSEKEVLDKKHPLWIRLTNPKHDHCAHDFLGDAQVRQTRKDYNSRGKSHSRYTAINYCYSQHRTVECRLLPMMETADQAIRAVHEVLNITNKFLASIRQKELKHQIRVPRGSILTEHFDAIV